MGENLEKKLEEVKATVQEWVDQQGHNRCWYYPDLFNKLVKILGIKPTNNPDLPPLDEFKKGCERYQQEEYKQGDQ